MAKGKYEYWLTEEGLLLLEGWARDGLTDEQIAHNIGISTSTLNNWKNKYVEILESLKRRDFRDLKKKEGERMSKLQDIYQRAYNNTPAATVDDNTVGEAVREQIEREKSRAGGPLSEDEWSDLVCLGTSYGQAQGFESGFRYALALIFESLSN